MKLKLFAFLIILPLLVISAIPSWAVITSPYQVKSKAVQIQGLVDYNLLSFVNKSELVGYRLNTFQMNTQYYLNSVNSVKDTLYGLDSQINIIQNSSEMSDTEKDMQIKKLMSDADLALSELDSKTVNYILGLKNNMPSVTYQNYARKFIKYYNSLNLSGYKIEESKW